MDKKKWWYLSFADKKFLGGAVVCAEDMISAVIVTHLLGINPGGNVKGTIVPDQELWRFEDAERNRLLTRIECEGIDHKVRK